MNLPAVPCNVFLLKMASRIWDRRPDLNRIYVCESESYQHIEQRGKARSHVIIFLVLIFEGGSNQHIEQPGRMLSCYHRCCDFVIIKASRVQWSVKSQSEVRWSLCVVWNSALISLCLTTVIDRTAILFLLLLLLLLGWSPPLPEMPCPR